MVMVTAIMVAGSRPAHAAEVQCPASPSYTPDFGSNQGCIQLNGNAGFAGDSSVELQLTTSAGDQVASAWYTTPQVITNGFSTSFQFQFLNPSTPPADGITFVIQNSSLNAIGYTGGNGGALGYGDHDSSTNPSQGEGIPQSLAIEFDTFQNGWDGAGVPHVAIQSCGMGRNTSHHGQLCNGTSGANSTIAAPVVTSALADGNVHSVTINYSAAAGNTPANIHVILDGVDLYPNGVQVDLSTIGLGDGGTAYVGFAGATGGSWETQDILNWTFQTIQGQQIDPNNPGSLQQSFVFNNEPQQQLQFNFDYTQPGITFASDTVPFVSNHGVTHADYQKMVAGTSLATTDCYGASGEGGTDSNGNALCAQLTIECTNGSDDHNPEGDKCPQSDERNLLFSHILDTPTTITVPAGTGPSMTEGSDNWGPPPAACSFIGPETGDLCPQNFQTQLFVQGTDALITGGGTGKTSNSAFIEGCCEPEWNTVPTVPLYSKTTTVPVSFTANPPTAPPPPNNNWVAAPNQSITWGVEAATVTLDPTFPIAGDMLATNPTSCPSSWPPPGTTPPSFTANGTVSVTGGEGAYQVHFFSTACDGQEELLYIPQPNSQSNWAAFKTAPLNIDLTNPAVTGLTLNPPPVNGTYQYQQMVTASLTCTDPISNGVASGIAMCGPGVTNYGGQNPVVVTNATVDTSTLGVHSFGATDVAGNAATAETYTVVYSNADLAVIKIGPLLVRSGSNATYGIGAWNQGPGTANNVVISDVVPAGESFVSATYSLVQCTKSGCSVPPPGSTPCTFANNTVTCGPVATLAPIPNGKVLFTGVGVSLVTKVNAKAGSWITNTATVSSANPDPNTRNNSFSWLTYVSK